MSTPPDLNAALADRYRIVRELGVGGMATVHLAEDLKHKRRVAIKVLRPELAAALGAERFLREIETTAGMRHPHILPLFDSGEVNGQLFYVMPLVEGETLRERLDRDTRLPTDEALRIAREVADALGYAHARGIVHRDIKPENIFLEAGHAVVADFGIARAVNAAGGDRVTRAGIAVGTPLYMSPEQAIADDGIDGRSDLYSLGCLLYEMLAGQPPFTGPSMAAIARQHLITDAPSVTDVRPDVSLGIARVLQRALAKDPNDRFASAELFVKAITTAETDAARGVHPPDSSTSEASRAQVAARSSKRAIAGIAVAVAVLLGGFAFWSQYTGHPRAIQRIAVLPLDNGTNDTTQQFFADGMTREIIGVLSDVGVRVLGHRAVASYRGSTMSPSAIAKALDVDGLVTGVVTREGDEIRVAYELIDARSGDLLDGRTVTRPATAVLSLQRQIAGDIARRVRGRLTPDQTQRLSETRTVEPRAYAQYLLGQEQANLRTPDGFTRSFVHFRRSLAIDSTFAPAWAAMATSSAFALIYQTAPRDSTRALLERSAARAMALDDRIGDSYYALATLRVHMDWKFAEADRLYAEGARRTPSTQGLALFGWALWELGRWKELLDNTRTLIAQEPTTAQWRSDMAWCLWSSQNVPAARVSADSAILVDSAFYEAHDILSLILKDQGDYVGAERAHAKAIAVAGGDYWVRQFNTGMIAAAKGDTATVRKMLKELNADPRLAQRAALHYLAGDKAAMYAMFDRAVKERDPDILQVMNAMPILYPVRKEAQYKALLAKVGLPEALR